MKSYNASKSACFILDQKAVKILSSYHVLAFIVDYSLTLFGKRFLGIKTYSTGVLWSKFIFRKMVYKINYKAAKTAIFILGLKLLQFFTTCHVQALIANCCVIILRIELWGIKIHMIQCLWQKTNYRKVVQIKRYS